MLVNLVNRIRVFLEFLVVIFLVERSVVFGWFWVALRSKVLVFFRYSFFFSS